MIKSLVTVAMASAFTLSITGSATAVPAIKHVFVIVMENTNANQIYGQNSRAPYINNKLMPNFAHATKFVDPLPKLDSEPHYIWMEAGTNRFGTKVFDNDDDPSPSNSTATTDHLVTQIEKSGTVSWMTYQESMNSKTGDCPIASNALYAAKHNPFVFFHRYIRKSAAKG